MSEFPFGRAMRGRSARPYAAVAGLLLLAGHSADACAHVTLETREAPARSFFKGRFLVSHGCAGSPTVSIQVTVPAGVVGVKPMPKPGWTLTVADGPYAHPVQLHGKTVASGVLSVTWSGGSLPDAWADEFTLVAQLPDQPAGTVLYFPVVQQCESGIRHWTELPGAAGAVPSSKEPAPALSLTVPAP